MLVGIYQNGFLVQIVLFVRDIQIALIALKLAQGRYPSESFVYCLLFAVQYHFYWQKMDFLEVSF